MMELIGVRRWEKGRKSKILNVKKKKGRRVRGKRKKKKRKEKEKKKKEKKEKKLEVFCRAIPSYYTNVGKVTAMAFLGQ